MRAKLTIGTDRLDRLVDEAEADETARQRGR